MGADSAQEFVAKETPRWLDRASVDRLYIQKASPWEHGDVAGVPGSKVAWQAEQGEQNPMDAHFGRGCRGAVALALFGWCGVVPVWAQGEGKGNAEMTDRCQKLVAKLDAGEQVTIVALGDSNTELTFHTQGRLNWVGLLQVGLFQKYGPNKAIVINAGHCGEGAAGGLTRLQRDVLRFSPDLVIVCYWDGNMAPLRQIVERVRQTGAEVLLRTPNPVVATNQPRITPPLKAGREWPGSHVGPVAAKIVQLGQEMKCPVVDHYTAWIKAIPDYQGPPAAQPNVLWLRMSDAFHPGALGHQYFYREMAPYFGLPPKLPWE